jgi:hypothetical protein
MGTTPVSDPLLDFDSEEDLRPRTWPPATPPKMSSTRSSFEEEVAPFEQERASFEEDRRVYDELPERLPASTVIARVLAMVAILTTVGVAGWLAFFRSAQLAPVAAVATPTGRDVDLPRTTPVMNTPTPGETSQGPDVAATSGDASAVPLSSRDASSQTARRTASRSASASEAGPVAGWLSVTSPIDLDIRENGALVGTTTMQKVMLAVGRHQVELSSRLLGYREVRTIDVRPGSLTALKIVAPNGMLNVNALPWADVSVDGRNVGQTPLANISLSLGSHEVVLRNPAFGERRQTVVITLHEVSKVGVDFSKR